MKGSKTQEMVYIGMFTVILIICSWITIPTLVPFTLQTFGIFLSLALLGGKNGTLTILLYLLLGCLGIPVFSHFGCGLGYLLGSSGGYLLGFLLTGCIVWFMEHIFGKKDFVLLLSLVFGLLGCYLFGTLHFCYFYWNTKNAQSFQTALSICVIPFLIPDGLKLFFAYSLAKRIRRIYPL